MGGDEVFLLDGEEIVLTDRKQVSCDGGNGALGHPVEFLTLERDAQAVCKYCDRRFVHKSHGLAPSFRERGRAMPA